MLGAEAVQEAQGRIMVQWQGEVDGAEAANLQLGDGLGQVREAAREGAGKVSAQRQSKWSRCMQLGLKRGPILDRSVHPQASHFLMPALAALSPTPVPFRNSFFHPHPHPHLPCM